VTFERWAFQSRNEGCGFIRRTLLICTTTSTELGHCCRWPCLEVFQGVLAAVGGGEVLM